MLEYELVDANGGIQKVRVEPATRSVVATCNQVGKILCDIIKPQNKQRSCMKILQSECHVLARMVTE